MTSVEELCRDLAAEQGTLDRLLGDLAPGDWHRPTPAAGWDVQDSISHLCFFEEAAALSVEDPVAFGEHRRRLLEEMAAANRAGPASSGDAGSGQPIRTGPATPDVALGRDLDDPPALLERWQRARRRYIEAVTGADQRARRAGEKLRVEWYGPTMSAASFTTARILEAWAHGVDIRDALGVDLEATDRLRHICHIGYGARAFSFAAHGQVDPGDPVRLEVRAPTGAEIWVWGPPDATDLISGPALDVALVFAQRRHRARTGLEVAGATAEKWIAIAQAFAGPPTVTAEDR